jgi:hypothetical protein
MCIYHVPVEEIDQSQPGIRPQHLLLESNMQKPPVQRILRRLIAGQMLTRFFGLTTQGIIGFNRRFIGLTTIIGLNRRAHG